MPLFHKIFALLNASFLYIYCRLINFFKPLSKNRVTIFFDPGEKLLARYIFNILYVFSGEFNILLYRRIRFRNFLRAYSHEEYIYYVKNSKIIRKIPAHTNDMVLVHDRESAVSGRRAWKHSICLHYDVFSAGKDKAAFILPFQMHPELCHNIREHTLSRLRNKKRARRIFFSGNMDRKLYDSPDMEKTFHKLSRVKVLETLLHSLDSEEVSVFNNESKFLRSGDAYIKRLVLLEFRIKRKHWLDTLAESDFFLSPPGISMPICHNIIEAMAVGTIPVTESPECFNPPLQHLENCVVFSGKEDLVQKIRYILNMDQERICRLRQNAAAYFERYIAPAGNCARFRSCYDKISRIVMNLKKPVP